MHVCMCEYASMCACVCYVRLCASELLFMRSISSAEGAGVLSSSGRVHVVVCQSECRYGCGCGCCAYMRVYVCLRDSIVVVRGASSREYHHPISALNWLTVSMSE